MKPMTEKHLAILRRHMVDVVGIHVDLASEELGKETFDDRVMAAMEHVPRHLFVPEALAALAYQDTPLPIGFDKTVSQPFIVALMADLLLPGPDETVLEVGSGLGYQAAVLSELAGRVVSLEIVEEFAAEAQARLQRLGVFNVEVIHADGARGRAEDAPFGKILVTAAAERVPPPLLEQLAPGGRLVMPLGPADTQILTAVDKSAAGVATVRPVMPVRFGQLETVV
jgi:protein-L-isoaspartate(D-aspartate) O-methyltransferase